MSEYLPGTGASGVKGRTLIIAFSAASLAIDF